MAEEFFGFVDTRKIMNAVAKEVDKDLAKQMQLWSRTVGRNLERSKGLKELNIRFAEGARDRAITAYEGRQSRGLEPYRQGDQRNWKRYSNGKMLAALKDKESIRADEKGIYYISKSRMDDFAKQWYRLNFGTASGGTKKAANSRGMKFFGVRTKARASLEEYGPSEDFMMPAGFWSRTFTSKTPGAVLEKPAGAPNDAFYAARPRNNRGRDYVQTSKGHKFFRPKGESSITGQRFLDAGASYINSYYGRSFTSLAKKWLRE